MKIINVTDEMYEFLVNLSTELNTQDHRATAMPYFFQIQTQEIVPAPEYSGTEAYHFDGDLIETDEEIKYALSQHYDWSENEEAEFRNMDKYTIEELLEKAGYTKVHYDIKNVYKNAFLTEKACKAHIEQNKHHYDKPQDYLMHAFRNPELEKVMQFLCELTKGKLHK